MKKQSLVEASENTNENVKDKGFKIKANGTNSDVLVGEEDHINTGFTTLEGYQGDYHSHPPGGIKIFSPGDVRHLLFNALFYGNTNANKSEAFTGLLSSQPCSACPNGKLRTHYVLRYIGASGNYLANLAYAPNKVEEQKKWFEKQYSRQVILSNSSATGDILNEEEHTKLFGKTLVYMGLNPKDFLLQSVDSNNNITNINFSENGTPIPTPCP